MLAEAGIKRRENRAPREPRKRSTGLLGTTVLLRLSMTISLSRQRALPGETPARLSEACMHSVLAGVGEPGRRV